MAANPLLIDINTYKKNQIRIKIVPSFEDILVKILWQLLCISFTIQVSEFNMRPKILWFNAFFWTNTMADIIKIIKFNV